MVVTTESEMIRLFDLSVSQQKKMAQAIKDIDAVLQLLMQMPKQDTRANNLLTKATRKLNASKKVLS